MRLQINFYQSNGALIGFTHNTYVNVKNLSGCNVDFSKDYQPNLDVQVRNANVVTSSPQRSITRVATSWGQNETSWTSYDIGSAPIGTVQDQIDWHFSGTLPSEGLGDNEADLVIDFGDAISGIQRWNDYITVTPLATSGAPTFASTGAMDTSECRAYYEKRLATWVSPFQFYVAGTIAPYDTGDGVPISAGTMIDSRKTGNFSVYGSASKDGIW